MITVVIQGGLGNQLFQYAYGRALIEMGKEVIFNISFYDTNTKYTKREFLLDKFCIPESIRFTKELPPPQKLLTRIINKIDIDRRVRYVPINPKKDGYLADGYYVSEKYFAHIRDLILKELTLKNPSPLYKEWEERINSATTPLMIHARRTDHVANKTFTLIDESYYEKAITYFDKDCEVFGFSDNAEWLRSAFPGRTITMVSGNGLTDYEELMLMSLGQNFIIANSTYSWWGSWLSTQKDKKIVILKKWYRSFFWRKANNDVAFEGWVRI